MLYKIVVIAQSQTIETVIFASQNCRMMYSSILECLKSILEGVLLTYRLRIL